jgi:hypothetical protein
MIPILAHGALGPFDELIFGGVGVVFVVMMAISWIRSRNAPLDYEDEAEQAPTPENAADTPDHVTLK